MCRVVARIDPPPSSVIHAHRQASARPGIPAFTPKRSRFLPLHENPAPACCCNEHFAQRHRPCPVPCVHRYRQTHAPRHPHDADRGDASGPGQRGERRRIVGQARCTEAVGRDGQASRAADTPPAPCPLPRPEQRRRQRHGGRPVPVRRLVGILRLRQPGTRFAVMPPRRGPASRRRSRAACTLSTPPPVASRP